MDAQGSKNQQRISLAGKGNSLSYLGLGESVFMAFGFNRYDILSASLIKSNVEVIDLALTFSRDCRSPMILNVITSQSEKAVNQPIVENLRQ